MRFEKIMIVGSGKIACDCVRYLITIINKEYLEILETQGNSLSLLEKICLKEKIIYSKVLKKKDIELYILERIVNQKVLIISANNRFIFTKKIIESKGVEIINFHYALLPRYRGMNIPTWVIYNAEKETGITWHYVTEEIDQGNIICQKKITISDSTTAFEITRNGMLLGIKAFREFIGELLNRCIDGKAVDYLPNEKIYKNSELPMNGILNLEQSIYETKKMLRSFDYGGISVIPKLKVCCDDIWYEIEKYSIVENSTDIHMLGYEKIDEYIYIYDEKLKITLYIKHLNCKIKNVEG